MKIIRGGLFVLVIFLAYAKLHRGPSYSVQREYQDEMREARTHEQMKQALTRVYGFVPDDAQVDEALTQ